MVGTKVTRVTKEETCQKKSVTIGTMGTATTSHVQGSTSVGDVREKTHSISADRQASVPQETNDSHVHNDSCNDSGVNIDSPHHSSVNTDLSYHDPSVIQETDSKLAPYIQFWKDNLVSYDKELTDTILHDIEHGVNIQYQGKGHQFITPNWPTSQKHHSQVSEFIDSSVKSGRVEGPLGCLPEVFHGHPLGAVPKRNSSQVRIIHDLSYPSETSTNSGIPKHLCSVSYSSVSRAVKMIQDIGGGKPVYMAKTDLKEAYLQVSIRKEDRNLLGFSWPNIKGKLEQFRFAVMPFGLGVACATFERFSTALEYIASHQGASPATTHYVDDFWTGETSPDACMRSLNIIIQVCEQAGFPVNYLKTLGPHTALEFLGIIIDSVLQECRLSPERLSQVIDELKSWCTKSVVTKRELLHIIGRLQFCSSVVRDSHHFTRRLIELSKKPKANHHKVKLSTQAKKDLIWWLRTIEANNGVSWFKKQFDMSKALLLFTDASNLGLGISFEQSWTMVPFTGKWAWAKHKSINYRELLAVLVGIVTYARRLAGSLLVMQVDNMSICQCLASGKSKNPDIMALIRSVYYYCNLYNIDYHPLHLYTHENAVSDSLSRLKLEVYKSMMPYSDMYMTDTVYPRLDF